MSCSYLRDFQDNEKSIPTILTTSQKLSTGVDVRNVRNIVLMRPMNSMIEFKQIIGRGTRLYDGKDYFTIYDFVKAYRNFSDPGWDGPPEPDHVADAAHTHANARTLPKSHATPAEIAHAVVPRKLATTASSTPASVSERRRSPLTREARASQAKVAINSAFNAKQQAFLDLVLDHYVGEGVEELDQDKLTPLLRLRYQNSISDALADLGRAEEIGQIFSGFQKHLYQDKPFEGRT